MNCQSPLRKAKLKEIGVRGKDFLFRLRLVGNAQKVKLCFMGKLDIATKSKKVLSAYERAISQTT